MLRKRMRSSGTPCCRRTSMACIAEPPVADANGDRRTCERQADVRDTSTSKITVLSFFVRTKHGVEKQHPSVCNVLWQLCVDCTRGRTTWSALFNDRHDCTGTAAFARTQLRHCRLLVSLNENLANPHRAATLAQPALHRLAGTEDAYTTDPALKRHAVVGQARRCLDRVLERGQVVEPLLDEEPDDAVAVEDEVGARRPFVPDDRQERIQLRRLRQPRAVGRHRRPVHSVPRCCRGRRQRSRGGRPCRGGPPDRCRAAGNRNWCRCRRRHSRRLRNGLRLAGLVVLLPW